MKKHGILTILSNIEKALIAGLLLFNVMILFTTVVMRYLFNNPPVWPEETSRYVMIWIIYLGVSQSIEIGSEIKIDILTQLTSSPWVRHLAPIMAGLIGLSASLLMVVFGVQFAQMLLETEQVAASFPAKMVYIYTIIPLAGGLMSVKYVVQLAGHFSRMKSHVTDIVG